MEIRKLRRLLFSSIVAAAATSVVWPIFACVVENPLAVFTTSLHPDLPLRQFAAGRLGVLEPTYARSYLFVAWRLLNDRRLSSAEQMGVDHLWKKRIAAAQPFYYGEPSLPADIWLTAKRSLLEAKQGASNRKSLPGDNISRSQGSYAFDNENCLADAFSTARATLLDRAGQFGPQSTFVKSWVEAQDSVFANCTGQPSPAKVILPAAAPADAPALARADRSYQTAAAYFYAARFDEAEARFRAIAADASSPWRPLGALLVARSRIRKATYSSTGGQTDVVLFTRAEVQLQSVLADPQLAAVHASARRLMGLVEARLHPEARALALAKAIAGPGTDSTFEQDVSDYTVLLDKFRGEWGEEFQKPDSPEAKRAAAILASLRSSDPMTDWILTFQDSSAEAFGHSYDEWQKTQSQAWLVAALLKATGKCPQRQSLLAAAEQVPADSPAHATVEFHRLRLLIESGREPEARALEDGYIKQSEGTLPPSAMNLFRALRFELAQNFEEFLRVAPRTPSTVSTDVEGLEIPPEPHRFMDDPKFAAYWERMLHTGPLFDNDAAFAFNRSLPESRLAEAAESPALPTTLRARIASAAWVRALLLEDMKVADALAPVVALLTPALAREMGAFLNAPPGEARRFAAVFALLHLPGLRPYVEAGIPRNTPLDQTDAYRDNWWCQFAEPDFRDDRQYWRWFPAFQTDITGNSYLPFPGWSPKPPKFLNAGEGSLADSEWKRLEDAPPAPEWMGWIVLAWAKAHPGDSRVPEALHLVVHATRYGCQSPGTGKVSEAAFDLLHRRYPSSPWARQTKYWFKAYR